MAPGPGYKVIRELRAPHRSDPGGIWMSLAVLIRRHLWLILALLAFALTFTLYAMGFSGGWVLDDITNIVENPALLIHGSSLGAIMNAAWSFEAGPLRRPISMLTFAFNRTLFGPAPLSFKITNVLIHLVNGLLLLGFTRGLLRIGRTIWQSDWSDAEIDYTALATVAAWLLLPLNVTSVLYVVQREASLAATFTIAGAWFYLRLRKRLVETGKGWRVLIPGFASFLILASFTKESGALLPVYTLLLEALLFRFRNQSGRPSIGIIAFYGVFLILPGVAGLIWMYRTGLFGYVGMPFTLGERLLSEPRAVLHYIGWALLPTLADFSVFHHLLPSTGWLEPPSTLLSAAALLLLVVLAFLIRRKNPLAALGIGWFFAGQLMESTIFPLELVFEQRNYLADYGLVLTVFSLLILATPKLRYRSARISVALLLIAFYAFVTAQWTYTWRNNLALALDQAAFHEQSPRATYFLGQVLSDLTLTGHPALYPAAIGALERASQVPQADILPEAAAVILSEETHHPTPLRLFTTMEARLEARSLTASDLQGLQAIVSCETVKHCHLPPPWMRALFQAAFRSPSLSRLNFTKGNLLVLEGNWLVADGKPLARIRPLDAEAARLNPQTSQYRINLATIDLAMGHLKAARRDLDLLKPLNWMGRLNPAIQSLTHAIQARAEKRSEPPRRHPRGSGTRPVQSKDAPHDRARALRAK